MVGKAVISANYFSKVLSHVYAILAANYVRDFTVAYCIQRKYFLVWGNKLFFTDSSLKTVVHPAAVKKKSVIVFFGGGTLTLTNRREKVMSNVS